MSASIDRSSLDGTKHEKIITIDIFEPLGITVDEPYGKIYWTDDRKGIYYRIERSNFDGTDRELVIERRNQEPFAIAALNNAIYWTDTIEKNVWMLSSDMTFPNHTKAKLEPDLFHHYKNYQPNGIVAFSNGTFECDVILKVPTQKIDVTYNDDDSVALTSDYCLNSGDLNENSCKCKKGFSGKRCEVSVCYNYCLNGGQCYLEDSGFPECRCLPGYEGSRCDKDACDGFCLNGGRCHINNSIPLCTCGNGYFGQRCEGITDQLCERICADSPQNSFCDCDVMKSKYDVVNNEKLQWPGTTCDEQRIVMISLTCFSAVAMLVIVFLTRKVCVLRRRPRIKKRIIVNKGMKSQTPLTARPHPSSPTEQCEITIENCCNMNICETVSRPIPTISRTVEYLDRCLREKLG